MTIDFDKTMESYTLREVLKCLQTERKFISNPVRAATDM